ncbi:aquaporin Z [Streptococcus pneumoniae]|nr:aquaporin Z [Streptococcus pneumoniae]VND18621.1 aquaporin Z [Streptococcus pneumoniae]VSU66850.1 aquaporin Z [Streptococcus pneumoniae]
MYQDLLRKIAEEKPNYNQEEIQWLFDHLGNPSPEIRDDLIFTSFAKGIQEELFIQEQFHFIAEGVSSDVGLDKEIDKVGLPTLERSFRALVYANLLSADANQQSVFYQGLQSEIRDDLSNQEACTIFQKKRIQQVSQVSMVGFILLHMEPIY